MSTRCTMNPLEDAGLTDLFVLKSVKCNYQQLLSISLLSRTSKEATEKQLKLAKKNLISKYNKILSKITLKEMHMHSIDEIAFFKKGYIVVSFTEEKLQVLYDGVYEETCGDKKMPNPADFYSDKLLLTEKFHNFGLRSPYDTVKLLSISNVSRYIKKILAFNALDEIVECSNKSAIQTLNVCIFLSGILPVNHFSEQAEAVFAAICKFFSSSIDNCSVDVRLTSYINAVINKGFDENSLELYNEQYNAKQLIIDAVEMIRKDIAVKC